MATSTSYDGFTWVYDGDYTTGTYANGDPWVLNSGGLQISSITPASADVSGWIKNGTMVNPSIGTQGYDSSTPSITYNSALNVAPSIVGSNLVFAAGQSGSVCSSESQVTQANRPQLKRIAILTVVTVVPAAGDFRPAYCGTDKTSAWNVSDIDWSPIYDQLTIPAAAPSWNTVEGYMARPWIEHGSTSSWTDRYIHPSDNQPDYGRDMAKEMSDALLMLCSNADSATKQTTLVNMLQYGIDIYGAALQGKIWTDLGGHNQGRKMPLLLAALCFNDAGMLAYCDQAQHNIFQEDRQTFYVAQSDVDQQHAPHSGNTWTAAEAHNPATDSDNRRRTAYTSAMIGTPEWGEQHTKQHNRDGSNWGVLYRQLVHNSIMGHWLMARATAGAETAWNWQAFFDYMARAYSIDIATAGDTTNDMRSWWVDMIGEYDVIGGSGGSGTTPPPSGTVENPVITPSNGAYEAGFQIAISCATAGAAIYYTTDSSTPTEADMLYTGPISLDGLSDVEIHAKAFKAGLNSSQESVGSWDFAPFSQADAWEAIQKPSKTGTFTVQWDWTPLGSAIDLVTAIAPSKPAAYTDCACLVRFNASGNIDVRNGGSYGADTTYAYTSGVEYEIQCDINIATHTYTVTVTEDPNGTPGTPTVIATDYAFRTEQASATSLAYVGWIGLTPTDIGSIDNIDWDVGSTGIPNIVVSGLSAAADGVTVTGVLSGGNGTYTPSSNPTGYTIKASGQILTIDSISVSGSAITFNCNSARKIQGTEAIKLSQSGGNLTDGTNTALDQSNVTVSNISTINNGYGGRKLISL